MVTFIPCPSGTLDTFTIEAGGAAAAAAPRDPLTTALPSGGITKSRAFCLFSGGEGEIRTPESLATLPVFKTGAFNRSATSPV